MDYPSLNNFAIRKDTRGTSPGGGLASTPGYVITENGDMYIKTNSGEQGGNNPNKPSGILRIKNGETTIDPDYFMNTSELTGGAWQQGLWYIGNGKAITKSFKGLYYSALNSEIWEYYIVDIYNKTMSRINVPLSDGLNFRNEPLILDGKAHLAVISSTDGINIYSYDLATGAITKGLNIQAVDGIQAFFKEDQ